MGINLTLLVQVLTFAALVWAMKRLLWEPMMRQIAERHRRLGDGAAAAERARLDLELAERRALEIRAAARATSAQALAQAERVAAEVAEVVRAQARAEAARLVQAARYELEDEARRVRAALRAATGPLAAAAAARLLDGARTGDRLH